MRVSLARGVIVGAALAGLWASAPGLASAAESVTLHTSFSPDRLGASTTIGFGFSIATTDDGAPPPLESVDLNMPAGINYLSTTLGLAICQPAALLAKGLAGCSPNSRLGFGSAYVEVPFGRGAGREIPNIQALMGPPHNGNIVVLFYANGLEPVYAQIVFEGELIAGTQTLGGSLDTAVPLVPSVAGGPPVSIVRVNATIGPAGLTYYEQVRGRTVSFHPQGVSVPSRCPRGGFAFSARFAFADGTSALARSDVPCPRRS
ncbi:MAG TPA: hypothetical protein VED41_08000 [Solirubrobacteraceae bacterium]|nr:hypothetical protein [Solirubrobacteraceae bacterium]